MIYAGLRACSVGAEESIRPNRLVSAPSPVSPLQHLLWPGRSKHRGRVSLSARRELQDRIGLVRYLREVDVCLTGMAF